MHVIKAKVRENKQTLLKMLIIIHGTTYFAQTLRSYLITDILSCALCVTAARVTVREAVVSGHAAVTSSTRHVGFTTENKKK